MRVNFESLILKKLKKNLREMCKLYLQNAGLNT